MAYDKKPGDGYWIPAENGDIAVHIGHVGEHPYVLFGGTEAKFSIRNALTIALQITRHAIIAKIRKY